MEPNNSRTNISSHVTTRAAIYTRVSTTDQDPGLQLRELGACAAQQGWPVVATYQDVISGAKSRRPGLDRLLADARARKFQVLLVWKLDRFGHSLVDCLTHIQAIEKYGIRFVATTQGLDTDQQNPASRFMLQVLGAAAELERSLIRERVKAGLEKAKAQGTRSGRPVGRPKVVFRRDQAVKLRRAGHSWRQIARELGVGVTTVRRVLSSV